MGVSKSKRDFIEQYNRDDITQLSLRLLVTEGKTNELLDWKDIPKKDKPYRKLKVEESPLNTNERQSSIRELNIDMNGVFLIIL